MEIWEGWTGDTVFSLCKIFSLCKHETKSSVINEHKETWVNCTAVRKAEKSGRNSGQSLIYEEKKLVSCNWLDRKSRHLLILFSQ